MTPEKLTEVIDNQIDAHRAQLDKAADMKLYDSDTIRAICRNVVAAVEAARLDEMYGRKK